MTTSSHLWGRGTTRQLAAPDRCGSVRGGLHSGSEFPGGGQSGVIDVVGDRGDTTEDELTDRDGQGTVLASRRTEFVVPDGVSRGVSR